MNNIEDIELDMLPEYSFDYSQAKSNRFARNQHLITVTLDTDVALVFNTSEAVNNVLRAIVSALPNKQML